MTILLHPDRYNITATVQKGGVVVHDAESGDGASATLVNLLQQPGDRVSKAGNVYGAGYHGVTDGLGGYVSMADGTAGPFSAPILNDTWWHVCMPGFANQTREQWLDPLSRAHIKGVAKFIYDKWIEDDRIWYPNFVFASQLVQLVHGYTSHAQVALAWKKTTHTDPGPNFPWDVLERDILTLMNPSEEDDMRLSVMTLTNTTPATTFLGYADKEGHFWEVYWIDGNNANEVKMLENQRKAVNPDGTKNPAPEFSYGEHVAASLMYKNRKLPSSKHASGAAWSAADWGAAPYLA
jgi:hypothetical protein